MDSFAVFLLVMGLLNSLTGAGILLQWGNIMIFFGVCQFITGVAMFMVAVLGSITNPYSKN